MMSETSSSPKRPRLDFEDSKDEQFDKFKGRDPADEVSSSISSKSRKRVLDIDDEETKDDDNKSKSFNREATPREHTLVMRLANKEQELQESLNQIQEMKQAQTQKTAHLRSMLLDPAINLVFQRMAKEMDEHKEKLKQKQNELSAWKFTPDSQTGMRLMAKCRMLLQENGDLGKMISSGRTTRLEGEIALHKALVTEMKKNQKELDEFVGDLEEDVEGMQGMIFMLQEQLKEAREQIARLQQENEQLRTLRMPPDPEPGGECEPMWESSAPPGGSPQASSSVPHTSSEPSSTARRTSSSCDGDGDSTPLPFAQCTEDDDDNEDNSVSTAVTKPSHSGLEADQEEEEDREAEASAVDTGLCRAASRSPQAHQPTVSSPLSQSGLTTRTTTTTSTTESTADSQTRTTTTESTADTQTRTTMTESTADTQTRTTMTESTADTQTRTTTTESTADTASDSPPGQRTSTTTTSSNGGRVSPPGVASPLVLEASAVSEGHKPAPSSFSDSSEPSTNNTLALTTTAAACITTEELQDQPPIGESTERTSQPDIVCTLNGQSESPPLSSSTEDKDSTQVVEASSLERTNHSASSTPSPPPVVSKSVEPAVLLVCSAGGGDKTTRTEEPTGGLDQQQQPAPPVPAILESVVKQEEGTVDSEAKENLVNGTVPATAALGQDL